jgi:hypothetical protein
MQNLTTMNLVDVILHTRVPPGRLVDWVDQAFLLIHLDKTDRTELSNLRKGLRQQDGATTHAEPCAESGAAARLNLRRVGIRTATDLLKAFSKEEPCGSLPERTFVLQPTDQQLPLPESQLRLLVRVLGAEPGLVPIWNWQHNGVPACQNQTLSTTSARHSLLGPTAGRRAPAGPQWSSHHARRQTLDMVPARPQIDTAGSRLPVAVEHQGLLRRLGLARGADQPPLAGA